MAEARISQDEFMCSVCLDLLKDPVAIPCGHSYCKICITGCWDTEDEKSVYSCPQCRQTFSARPALAKNTILAELVEKLKKTKLPADCYAAAGDVQCDVCTGRKHKAVKSCLVCLNSYCQNHLEQHESLFKGKRHNLTEATGRLQEMICPKHDKLLEVFCRTDQKCICVLCLMDEHKNHNTVSAAAQRTEKQHQLKETQRSFQQRIQQRKIDLQQLREAVDSHKRSAQTAVEDSERIFTQLIRSIERSRSEATQRIRDQEKTAVSRAEERLERLEQEINDLRRRNAELEQLSHTQDHIHFLQSFQSLSAPPESTDVNDNPFSSLSSFDGWRESVHKLRVKLEDFLKEELPKISDRATFSNIILKTRNDFLQLKGSGLPAEFSFASSAGPKMLFGPVGSEEPFSFAPKLSSLAPPVSSSTSAHETPKLPQSPKAQGNTGETLGCFSSLRVGQSEEAKDAPNTTLSFSFGPPINGSTGLTFSSPQVNPEETRSPSTEPPNTTTPQTLVMSTFAAKSQEGMAPSIKPTFSVPSTTSFSPVTTSFGSLLHTPLQETTALPAKPLHPETTVSSESTPSADSEPSEPSAKPLLSSAQETEAAAPTSTTAAPSSKPPTPPALEVSSTPPPPVILPSVTPTPVSEPLVEDPISDPALEITSTSTATPAPQEPPAAALTSNKPGAIFVPPLVGTISFATVVTTAASSSPSTAITTIAAPTPAFGQSPSVAPTTTFRSTSGFGEQSESAGTGFSQPTSSVTFSQAGFSASFGFGQLGATTTSATRSVRRRGEGGLFGASNPNSARSFSFGSSGTSSAAGSGTGLFAQSGAPGFGQPNSSFGQGSVFNSSTTTPSSGFGFGQQSGFSSNTSSSSVFGQQPSIFGQAQSGGGLFGSITGNSSSGSGFFSGLGGKPSEDAANKNPFGVPTAGGFGQPINAAGASNLFGNSGTKAFSFSSSSFGEQKPSGPFSTGAGSLSNQGFGSFSTPSKPAGFANTPVFGSSFTFGGSPAIGASVGFDSGPSFSNPLGGSSGKVFGVGTTASNVGGFGK